MCNTEHGLFGTYKQNSILRELEFGMEEGMARSDRMSSWKWMGEMMVHFVWAIEELDLSFRQQGGSGATVLATGSTSSCKGVRLEKRQVQESSKQAAEPEPIQDWDREEGRQSWQYVWGKRQGDQHTACTCA